MWRRIGLSAAVYAAAVLTTAGPGAGTDAALVIAWLPLVAAFVVWTLPPIEAAAWGVLLGLFGDAAAGGELGIGLMTMSTLAWAAAHVRTSYRFRSVAAFGLFTAGLTWLGLGIGGACRAWPPTTGIWEQLALRTAGDATVTALAGMALLAAWRTVRFAAVQFATAQRWSPS